MVKLPSGRILKTLFGGEKALSEALETLSLGKLDGLVKTSFTRDGGASVGYLVTRKGKPYLAVHDSNIELMGEEALFEIARDSVNDDCIIEVRSYSYKSSSISATHLGDSHPSGILGTYDVDSTLRIVKEEEKSRIEKTRKEASEKHMRDIAKTPVTQGWTPSSNGCLSPVSGIPGTKMPGSEELRCTRK